MPRTPLGRQVHLTLVRDGITSAQALAEAIGQPDLFLRVQAVALEQPVPSFLHSALCAMSLPVRRPSDETAPILRQDGQYALAITPRAVLRLIDGRQQLQILGVPFGSLPRLILIHIMTEAVRSRQRQIRLGASFTDWLRRMGYRTISYGPRGSATLVRQQLDRLLACEWMIRWDGQDANGSQEFGIKEIKLTNEYVGTDAASGAFTREILLTEGFYEHLREHAVPLNEHAIRQLRDSATALDLYTWLAYRLPRIGKARPAVLSWQQLAVHFGNDGTNIRKFRQTVRDAWDRQVSAVYPEARADFDTTLVRLHASPAPLQQTTIAVPKLQLVSATQAAPTMAAKNSAEESLDRQVLLRLRHALPDVEARTWLGKATSEMRGDNEPFLIVPTRFLADWIRQQYSQQLGEISRDLGLSETVQVVVRQP